VWAKILLRIVARMNRRCPDAPPDPGIESYGIRYRALRAMERRHETERATGYGDSASAKVAS
jgi:hypothetical protein